MREHSLNITRESENQKDSTNSNYELIKRMDVQDSPFMVITTEGKSFGVLANYRITQEWDTEEEAYKDVQEITWNRIIQVITILNEINEYKILK